MLVRGEGVRVRWPARRQFLAALGAAAIAGRPKAASAQHGSPPVIGYLGTSSAQSGAHIQTIFRQGLAAAGLTEGRDFRLESRWADGQYDRLPAMAADLVRRQVSVLVATPTASAVAAKAATAAVPIVFAVTDDPVALGLAASLARPSGNSTGVHFFLSDLAGKQFGLLHELVPRMTRVGVLTNPNNPNADAVIREIASAASPRSLSIESVRASNPGEFEPAFVMLATKGAGALVVAADPLFYSQRVELCALAARHRIPAIYNVREFAESGGLISYGTSLKEVHRQVGDYTARVLKGALPAELPVVQATRFELLINLKTAKALGIDVPPTLLARTDEVVE
jgi:putative tryptophan/tyrosine transport system substrate-binding protein